MAVINVSGTGYKTLENGVSVSESSIKNSDIYVSVKSSSSRHYVLGIMKFKTSINSSLGISASKWSDIKFSDVVLKLRVKTQVKYNDYYVVLTDILPEANTSEANLKGYKQSGFSLVGKTADVAAENEVTFNLTSIFNNMTNANGCTFTPSSTTWYIFLYRKADYSGSDRNFYRKNSYTTTLTISGNLKVPVKVYNGSVWKDATPYVYNGGWKKVKKIYRYNGSSWVEI